MSARLLPYDAALMHARRTMILTGALALTLVGCPKRTPTASDAGALGHDGGQVLLRTDGGQRIELSGEVPALGPSADRREIDVPLTSIFLLSDPAPTGSAPYAIVGATVPCGYATTVAYSRKDNGRVLVRLRARWTGNGAPPATPEYCATSANAVKLVSLSVLRVGDWAVVDEAAHGPTEPLPAPVTQHVLADDGHLPTPIEQWTRACSTDADCPGGLCGTVGTGRLCVAKADPWRHYQQACPPGSTPTMVTHGDGVTMRWEVCVGQCPPAGCPGRLRCEASRGVCVPSSTGGDAGATR